MNGASSPAQDLLEAAKPFAQLDAAAAGLTGVERRILGILRKRAKEDLMELRPAV